MLLSRLQQGSIDPTLFEDTKQHTDELARIAQLEEMVLMPLQSLILNV